jgi:regulator of RNase E activity RraB
MGLFNFFKRNNSRFVSEHQHNKNVAMQKQMNAKVLEQLNIHGVTDNSELELEFFFYTNKEDNASNLAIELNKLNYQINLVAHSASDKNQWVVIGWTTKMKMDLQTITKWTNQMRKLGCENDCDFDGWGTQAD